MPDLELATTDEIVDELGRRYESVIVAYIAPRESGDEGQLASRQYRGGWAAAIGLAEFFRQTTLSEIEPETKEGDRE